VSRIAQRLFACGAAVITAAALLVAQAPAATAADSLTDLGVAFAAQRGPDVVTGNDRLYVSAEDRIVAADAQGALTGAITGLASVRELAVTPDGTRLYAALSGSNEVAEIDTGSLSITRRFDLAAYPCPTTLSLAGSRLYVGHGCRFQYSGGVVSLDVSATQPQYTPIETGRNAPPLVAAAGQTLVVGITASNPGDLRVYDTSGTATTLRGVIRGDVYDMNNLLDIAISSDGSTLFSAFGSPYKFDAWDTTDLTLVRSYGVETSPNYPHAVALTPDGSSVIGARDSEASVTVFDAATGEKTFTYEYPEVEMLAGALAPIGRDVFAVVRDSSDRLHLWRVPDVTLPGSTLTLAAPDAVDALELLTLTGRLTLADGSPPGAQRVLVTRRLEDEPREPVAEVTTAVDGTFTLPDALPGAGTFRYDAVWDGTVEHQWSRASTYVTAARVGSSINVALSGTATVFEPLTLTGRITVANGAAPGEQHLTVTRQAPGGIRQNIPATTAADGNFTITDTPSAAGGTTYYVAWYQTAAYELAYTQVSVSVARAKTVLTLTGPEASVIDRVLEFSGTLAGPGLDPSRTRIGVSRTVVNRDGIHTTELPSVLLRSASFSFTDKPQMSGEYTYTLRWEGDRTYTYLPAETNHVVTVRGPVD
jgi:DNA-binding beta-propeller fold protein YncE